MQITNLTQLYHTLQVLHMYGLSLLLYVYKFWQVAIINQLT